MSNPTVAIALPPLQDAIMDVLAARHRLGETLWPFTGKSGAALRALEKRGFVQLMSGISSATEIRARLTDAGKAYAFSGTYQSPLEKEVARLRDDAGRLLRERNEARDALILQGL